MVVVAHKVKLHKPMKRKFPSGQKHVAANTESENAEEDMEEVANDEQNLSKDALVILQEINIARELGSNDPIRRNQQVRKLRRWLQLRTQSSFAFNEENFMRLWKGLYYCMYMADKPLYQEQLAENMGQLVHCFPKKVHLSIEFFGAFLNTMRNEWFGIDQWRMDKFYMLMRRMLRHMLLELRNTGWQQKAIELFNEQAKNTVLAERGCALAMTMHFMDIIFEELAKVSDGAMTAEQVNLFVQPFIDYLLNQADAKLFAHCRSRIFHHLLYQSALGREYQDKYEAWKEMGFPATIDDIEPVEQAEQEEVVEEEEEEKQEEKSGAKPLDPRAGNVDVFVPELPLDGQPIVERLQHVLLTMEMPAKRRKALRNLLQQFEKYQQGEFPLGVKTMPRFQPERETELPLLEEKVAELAQTEQELYGVSRQLKKLNKRKRRQLLKTLNFENVTVDEMDKVIEKALPKINKQQRLKQARHALMKGWIEEPLDDAAKLKKKLKIKQRLEKIKMKRDEKRAKKLQKNEITATELQPSPAKIKKVTMEDTIESAQKAWEAPLAEGEVEYFVPSRKIAVKVANTKLQDKPETPKSILRGKSLGNVVKATASPRTPGSAKRVKIALNHNKIQKPSDYLKQIKNSPDVPYDAQKKPGKGLLKANAMPSPVDPFYVKRHSLKLKMTPS